MQVWIRIELTLGVNAAVDIHRKANSEALNLALAIPRAQIPRRTSESELYLLVLFYFWLITPSVELVCLTVKLVPELVGVPRMLLSAPLGSSACRSVNPSRSSRYELGLDSTINGSYLNPSKECLDMPSD